MQALSAQRDQLGECPRWHAETQTLWWVDITQHQIHRHPIPTSRWRRGFGGCFRGVRRIPDARH